MSRAKSVIVYTAITGGRDPDRNDIKVFTQFDRFKDPRLNAKIYKVLPHLYLDVEWSIWVDGHVELRAPAEQIVELAQGHEVAVFSHPWQNCIYDEAETCIRLGLDSDQTIREQISRYQAEGYPKQNGLVHAGFIIRRHTPQVKNLCEKWWAEICRGSVRDQISFPYVFRNYFTIPGDIRSHDVFVFRGHSPAPRPLVSRALSKIRRTASAFSRGFVGRPASSNETPG